MAMTAGTKKGGAYLNLNITPLIDILLVLLIIFMIINPLHYQGLTAAIPQPNPHPPENRAPNTIVVSIDAAEHLRINQQPVDIEDLGARLEDIFKTRAQRVMFVQGDPSLPFDEVAKVIDIAKGAGADQVGLLTKPLKESQ